MEELPEIDFSVFTKPLDETVEAVRNQLEREWPRSLRAHKGTQMVVRLLLAVSVNTYKTMRYFCADVPPDPARKQEYALSAPPLARTILDALFTLVFLAQDPEARTSWFLRSGWREMNEKLERMRREHAADPSWTEYLADFERVIHDDQQLWAISDVEAATPGSIDYWPIPSQILREVQGTATGCYLQYLSDWFYRDLSQDSHLSWPGLFRRGGWFLFSRPDAKQQFVLRKAKSDSLSTAVTLLIAIASEIELLCRFGLGTRLRYLWGLFAPIAGDARAIYEMRFAACL